MKKITLGTALASLLALTACGETDTREKHIFTVEVEVTDTNGKIQKVKQDCRQLQNRCSAKFDLETPYGVKTFEVNAANEPINPEKVMAQLYKSKTSDDEDKVTDTDYKQRTFMTAVQFGSNRFKAPKFEEVNWTPRTERKIGTELKIPNPDLMKKIALLEEKKGEERKKMFSADFKKIASWDKEIKSLDMPDVKAADLKIRIY